MSSWVIINNLNNEMSVGKDGLFFDLDASNLADNIHAVQWDGSTGEVEYKDPETNLATHNETISSFNDYAFAETAWQSAYDAEQNAIALANAKSNAFQSAYDQSIANGDSEEDALSAGQAASDAVTSI